ncbi:MAG: FAD-linked oxidase C-terminal domain-containing protein, partial [Saprospiraceae bacterium]
MLTEHDLHILKSELKGDVYWDDLHKAIYATDASVYRMIPEAVIHPKNAEDIKKVVAFALKHKTSIIPRTAGTSLSGQCVGDGIILDTSRYMNNILEVNKAEKWVRVQPGVVRDKLNQVLANDHLFFPPETATANRAMIGGMVGNNSCGANSIVYGTTRDYVLEVDVILSDGSETTIKAFDLNKLPALNPLMQRITTHLMDELTTPDIRDEINQEFPKKIIHRRNTGYAVDLVLDGMDNNTFDLTKLICGSEGTLAITTEIKLRLVDPPGKISAMICPHFTSIDECMTAVITIMKHAPYTCELMDRVILKCTDGHEVYKQYKFFVDGDPAAILMVEFRNDDEQTALSKIKAVEDDLRAKNLGYAYPMIPSSEIRKVWDLRRAGLGLLANMEGDKKAIECIEDTAVALEDLQEYIKEFTKLMDGYGQKPLYYAHAGAGELHLRPVLNMHDPEDRKQFREICIDSAKLVKKFGGSLSGEHGDGRLRGELIPLVLGQKNYELLKRIKHTWDPENIFNPGKIVDALKLDEDIRHDHEKKQTHEIETIIDFDSVGGFYNAASRCSGSADCRKEASMGGTMCPSFMATKDEKDSTRARANALREFYSRQDLSSIKDMEEVKEILDLCLSCKGCHNECPSNVDMTLLKSEFMHQYRMKKGLSLRSRLFGEIDRINGLAGKFPSMSNWVQGLPFVKKTLGIHAKRKLPILNKFSFRSWTSSYRQVVEGNKQKIVFFIDEFSNQYDVELAIKTVKLLDLLGYPLRFIEHGSSGRALLSKGMLPEALKLARRNVLNIFPFMNDHVLVGIEPSSILSFRDEYPKLLRGPEKAQAKTISEKTFTIEEFLYHEIKKGIITSEQFDKTTRDIIIHGHCHQKALSNIEFTSFVLGLPAGHTVSTIPSGCCGMAGSFGYEEEHFDLSMKIGEMVLFPAVRKAPSTSIIVAAGTSCRHQIADGTNRKAVHPV